MSSFIDHHNLMSTMFMTFIFLFFLQTTAMASSESSVLELSGREDLVTWAGYGEDKLSTVEISGKLLCHAHENDKAPTHPNPVSGASVIVFCGASGKKRKSWARGTTDGYGEFLLDLPSHLHAIPNIEKICHVKVVHLPKSSPCRTSFTGKHKGIKLASIGDGVRTYTTHNIHLTMMPQPSQFQRNK